MTVSRNSLSSLGSSSFRSVYGFLPADTGRSAVTVSSSDEMSMLTTGLAGISPSLDELSADDCLRDTGRDLFAAGSLCSSLSSLDVDCNCSTGAE